MKHFVLFAILFLSVSTQAFAFDDYVRLPDGVEKAVLVISPSSSLNFDTA